MGYEFGFDDTYVATESSFSFGFVDKDSLGPELIVNQDFSSATWWLTGGGAAITGGEGVVTGTVGGTFTTPAMPDVKIGRTYKLTCDVYDITLASAVTIRFADTGTIVETVPTASGGTGLEFTITANTSTDPKMQFAVGSNVVFKIDNVSLRRSG